MNKRKEKRTALYMRTATADQFSIDRQEAELRQYAEDKDYTDVLTYVDNGQSGLSFDRPAFRQLQADIANGKISKVIVRDLTRISRNVIHAHGFMNVLKMSDVELDTMDGSHTFHKSRADEILRMTQMKNRSNKGRER
jgi:DNA invertase Pin-like site-specific DNA recombinase